VGDDAVCPIFVFAIGMALFVPTLVDFVDGEEATMPFAAQDEDEMHDLRLHRDFSASANQPAAGFRAVPRIKLRWRHFCLHRSISFHTVDPTSLTSTASFLPQNLASEPRSASAVILAFATLSQLPMPREHVILFRNPSTESGDERDPYESAIPSDRYIAHTLPVLRQEFVNESQLVEALAHSEDWAAVVATSKRAGEAWTQAVRSRKATNTETSKSCLRIPPRYLWLITRRALVWKQIPLYTPGSATTATFSAPDLPNSCFPTIVPGSEDTGCAEHLGPFIVSHLASQSADTGFPTTRKPFLVLTGDKNSSELTDILQRHQVAYRELEVYRTSPRPDIAKRLGGLLEDIVVGKEGNPDQVLTIWFVFFSPSSAEAVLRANTTPTAPGQRYWYDQIASYLEERHDVHLNIRMAAIGKTTGNYLRREEGFEDVVQAGKPNAEGMARAIAQGS
jgi:uroporphyrinogen-III synthase